MVADRKKRKHSPQSLTLHYYFPRARGKVALDHKAERPSTSSIPDKDIIVIDSDDNDLAETNPRCGISSTIETVNEVIHYESQTAGDLKSTQSSTLETSLFIPMDARDELSCTSGGAPTERISAYTLLSSGTKLEDYDPPPNGLLDMERTTDDANGPPMLNSDAEAKEADSVVLCPVCNIDLTDILAATLDVSGHVNDCLDLLAVRTHSKGIQPFSTVHPRSHSGSSSSRFESGNGDVSKNMFSVLTLGKNLNQVYDEAHTTSPNLQFKARNGQQRTVPSYKILQGMPIAVDAFQYGTIPGVEAYFLTHAHSDHYTHLTSSWNSGPIYCSQGTAGLIVLLLSVDPKWVHPLPMDVPFVIPNSGGVKVTLIEANHCPGSCLFLFERQQNTKISDSTVTSNLVGPTIIIRYLHCGDFRASPRHVLHPAIHGKRIDVVYLDTTYLDPKYTFPPQPLVVSACVELVQRMVNPDEMSDDSKVQTMDCWLGYKKHSEMQRRTMTRTLIVVGTYSIGKERIIKAIARALQTKVYCDERKAAILRCQNDPDLRAMMTRDPYDADVHILPLGVITRDRLQTYVDGFKGAFTKVLGFRPTGWTFRQRANVNQNSSISSIISHSQQRPFTPANIKAIPGSTPTMQIYGVPYSEHSSFFELTCFALSFDWGKMVPTVNVENRVAQVKMARWMQKWERERGKRGKNTVVPFRSDDYW